MKLQNPIFASSLLVLANIILLPDNLIEFLREPIFSEFSTDNFTYKFQFLDENEGIFHFQI